ncbi:MAG: hypothetical protein K5829_09450 [Treponema sp.]|nr:hypothetical protein [Treponema sp.]
MKKVLFTIALLSLLLLLVSCKGKEKQNSSSESQLSVQESDSKTQNQSQKPIVKKETRPAVVLYEGTPLYTENNEGKMIYATEVILGDIIDIYLDGDTPEQKLAIRRLSNGDEKELNFVHVTYEDTDYWTRDIFVTKYPSVKAGAILEDTLIYDSPEGTGATSKKLEACSIVAIDPNIVLADEDIGVSFVPVIFYNGTAFGKEVYVKESAISKSDYDVIALQTVAAIKRYKSLKPEVAAQLKDCLERLSISSAFDEVVSSAF